MHRSWIYKPLLHNVLVGHHNVYVFQFLPGKKAQFSRLIADSKRRFAVKPQRVSNDHHFPNMKISAESKDLRFFSKEELENIEIVVTHRDIVEDWFLHSEV